MKPLKFYVGQAVVCIQFTHNHPEEGLWQRLGIERPRLHVIYTVQEIISRIGRYGLVFTELRHAEVTFQGGGKGINCWDENGFAPVEEHPAEVIEALLEETLSPVKA